jgi:hypothetical protein
LKRFRVPRFALRATQGKQGSRFRGYRKLSTKENAVDEQRTAIAADAKFCHHCGQATGSVDRRDEAIRTYTPKHLADEILTRRSALEGEHKQVTVLFADVKGSMELAESGCVYITEHTARLIEGFFKVRDLGMSAVKGVSLPLRIYELEGVRR